MKAAKNKGKEKEMDYPIISRYVKQPREYLRKKPTLLFFIVAN
jgi:hypothetical protein